jgi:lipopolysaccharide transport system ATP-binding protein
MTYALKAEGLGKKYRLSKQSDLTNEPKSNIFSRVFAGEKSKQGVYTQLDREFWALKDVSFNIEPGARLGILGKNGAGKSTLLKILSRITEPTEGRVLVNGKMASLLEVGTGFHPELSGRENVFLNGSILGLSRSTIKARFDEILAFSGVEKFIDSPVKHYSSGMQVRLAFAVAAHLEPEILILDEVLAVGDVDFQNKCLEKMQQISSSGTTVIFVSHGVSSIRQFCNQALLLEGGLVSLCTTDVDKALDAYLNRSGQTTATVWERFNAEFDTSWYVPQAFRLVNGNGNVIVDRVQRSDEVYIEIHGDILVAESDLTIGYALFDENETEIYRSYPTDDPKNVGQHSKVGNRVFKAKVPVNILNSGTYSLKLVGDLQGQRLLYQHHRSAPMLRMVVDDFFSQSPLWNCRRAGILAIDSEWSLR